MQIMSITLILEYSFPSQAGFCDWAIGCFGTNQSSLLSNQTHPAVPSLFVGSPCFPERLFQLRSLMDRLSIFQKTIQSGSPF